eukprot:CAMPEP_0168751846 /NCGR_PEP_ID=MMETSP0724-20121128/18060_1 /TAXON_ID=265536 /ORGANISM="Amphiprora sp., Strain CCMP467" /LENGTH=198 /DNA_ID=CAMNT_0008800035 /DNA_START=41 /DNA_END=637 /DNA_ORIENTATION=+
MPTVSKEATVRYHSPGSSSMIMTDFINAFLREWLLNGPGYGLSKTVETSADIAKGTVLDLHLGGLLLIITNVDRTGGLVEFQMDPQTNLSNGPVLSSLHGEISVTEQDASAVGDDDNEGEQQQQLQPQSQPQPQPQHFHVVWKVDYTIHLLLNILSLGSTRLSLQNMWQRLMAKDLARVEKQLLPTAPKTTTTAAAAK